MEITTATQEDVILIRMQGSLDVNTAPELDTQLTTHLDCGCAKLVLDCAGLGYISSAGLRVFLKAAKRLQPPAKTFALCGLTPPVEDVLNVSGLLKVFAVFATSEEAIKSCGQK